MQEHAERASIHSLTVIVKVCLGTCDVTCLWVMFRIEEDEERERHLQQTIHTTASDVSLNSKDDKCVIQ